MVRILALSVVLLACDRNAPSAPSAPSVPSAPSATSAPQAHAAAIAAGHQRLTQVLHEERIPGLAVAVAIRGEVVWQEGLGFADIEHRQPVTADTRFRLASVSKLVTVAVLARLIDAGNLDLDAPASASLPDLQKPLGAVTARQLAGHLAGVRHYGVKDVMTAGGPYATVRDSLGTFVGDPLVAEPGRRYAYSSPGYVLLSALLERAGGSPFLELVHREVATPLQLASLGPDDGTDPRFTKLYSPGVQGPLEVPRQDQSARWASGGLRATARDLALLAAAQGEPGFVTAPTLALLFTSQKAAGGEATGVGLGWRIATDERGRRYVHHAGNMPGARSLVLLYPEQGVVIALLTNLSGTPSEIEALGIAVVAPFLP